MTMRLPVFGKPKFSREEMERVAATELAAAIASVPGPPEPGLASWTPPGAHGVTGAPAAAATPWPTTDEPELAESDPAVAR